MKARNFLWGFCTAVSVSVTLTVLRWLRLLPPANPVSASAVLHPEHQADGQGARQEKAAGMNHEPGDDRSSVEQTRSDTKFEEADGEPPEELRELGMPLMTWFMHRAVLLSATEVWNHCFKP